MSPSSYLSRRQCRIGKFYIFWFWPDWAWPFEDFLYGLIKVVLGIRCQMVDYAPAFAEIFQMPEARELLIEEQDKALALFAEVFREEGE